jgi:hypothetical protein
MKLPIVNTFINFSRHHFCCFIVASLFVLDKSTAWNRCLQHPCFKNLCKMAQASKNSDFNAQHFLSDLLKYSWFHSMLFALPGYQFPYTDMNRCFHLNYWLSPITGEDSDLGAVADHFKCDHIWYLGLKCASLSLAYWLELARDSLK